jgi:hypothetical protein
MRTAPGAQKFPGLAWMTQPLWPKAEGKGLSKMRRPDFAFATLIVSGKEYASRV